MRGGSRPRSASTHTSRVAATRAIGTGGSLRGALKLGNRRALISHGTTHSKVSAPKMMNIMRQP